MKITVQYLLFQAKIFLPSKIENGIRLNRAKKELIAAP
jgi:hypothetical protein